MHYYQHHIGDFIRDTSRLTDTQSMAYLRLLWLYYESEQPLPNNQKVLAMKIGCDLEQVELILQAFFKQDGDVWRHTRCDAEIAEYTNLCERNKANGKLGGRPRKTQWVSDGLPKDSEAEPSRNPNQEPITNNHKPINTKTPNTSGYSPEFDEAWSIYPQRPGHSKAGAFKAWNARLKAGESPLDMIEGAKRYAAYCKSEGTEPKFIKHAATFFGPDMFYRSDWTPSMRVRQEHRNSAAGKAIFDGVFDDE